MQYSQEHLKTMVYAKNGGQTECIMGNWKIENIISEVPQKARCVVTQLIAHKLVTTLLRLITDSFIVSFSKFLKL